MNLAPVSLWRHSTLPAITWPRLTMAEIAARVAARHGLSVEELKQSSSCFRISHPRQEAMMEMRAQDRWSLPQIGRFFGVDHTTVLHGVRAHARRAAASADAADEDNRA